MTLLFIYLSLAIIVSFICSLLEAVILSVSPAYIAVAVKKKQRAGILLQELKSQIDRPLAAILTLNTISHTVGAAGVGAQVNKLYGDAYLGLASAVLTLVILVFSEIIPKTLGASNWKTLAPLCAYLTKMLIWVAYPFVMLSEGLYNLLSREENEGSVTREEVIVTAEMGAIEGSIRPKESSIIKNLLMLDNIKVSDIMTPRSVIHAFHKDMTIHQVVTENQPIRFSRLPVYANNLDDIIGMVHRYKILEASSQDLDDLAIYKLMTPIHSIPEHISVAAVLDQFTKRKEHIFLVVDEYGSTTGLVSLEDAIETLLGVEIVDEFDSVADMRQYALEQWRERKQKSQSTKS